LQTASNLGPESPVTSETVETERINLTRRELESLVDEAVRQDRSRR